jgi:hypothetical protein
MAKWFWRDNRSTRRKGCRSTSFSTTYLNGSTWGWYRTSAARSRLLSAWTKVRPALRFDKNHSVKFHFHNKLKFHFHSKLKSHLLLLFFLSPCDKTLGLHAHKRPLVTCTVLCPYLDLFVFRMILRIHADYFPKQQKPVYVRNVEVEMKCLYGIQQGQGISFFCKIVRTGHGAYQVSSSLGKGGLFHGGNAAGAWS